MGWEASIKAMKRPNFLFRTFKMPRLNPDERWRALGMVQAGLSYSEVGRRFNCSHHTIRRLVQRHGETGSVADRPRPGRERVTTPDQDRYILNQHLRDRFRTASRPARETPGRHNPRISSPTVRRRLRAANLNARRPLRGNVMTHQRRHNRLQWCQERLRWTQRQWGAVLFTDESRFCVDHADGRERVWRRRGERYAPCCIRQVNGWGGPSVMVWAGISLHHKTPLVVVEGTLTAQRYIRDILEPHVVPFLQQHQDVGIFQQDNARPHAAGVTRRFLEGQNVQTLPWPRIHLISIPLSTYGITWVYRSRTVFLVP